MDTASEGPDAWCYDALTMRRWEIGHFGQVVVLRTLEVVWETFDHNPGVFATCVDGTQPLEDFLAGPPAVATSPELLSAVRDHLLAARTLGRSTWIELDLRVVNSTGVLAPEGADGSARSARTEATGAGEPMNASAAFDGPRLCSFDWHVDGANPHYHPGPGADSAGSYGEPLPPAEGTRRRSLVTPGAHCISTFVMVRTPGGRQMHALRLDVSVEVAPNERASLSLALDLAVTPPVLVRT